MQEMTLTEDDNLQGFFIMKKSASKSKILNMVCAVRSLETSTKITLKNGYK
jgi:hypothetical protein